MEDLTTWWEIPCIGQFVSLFRFAFNLPEMDIEELEEGFIADGAPGGSVLLQNLLVSLLQGYVPKQRVSRSTSWETHLQKVLDKTWVKIHKRENPVSDIVSFSELSVRTKVEIVYCLCLHRLDCNDSVFAMKSMDADSLRVQSLGSDCLGNVYWYFYGTRLYKEEPPKNSKKESWKDEWDQQLLNGKLKKRGPGRPRKNSLTPNESNSKEEDGSNGFFTLDSRSRWSVVCTTLEEWKRFADRFSKSTAKCEIGLYKIIKNNFLPALSAVYEEKEKRQKRKSSELADKRSSSRNNSKKQKKDKKSEKPFEPSTRENPDCLVAPSTIDTSSDRSRRFETRQRTAAEKKCWGEPRPEASQEPVPSSLAASDAGYSKKSTERGGLSKHIMDRNLQNEYDLYPKLGQVLTTVKLHKDSWPFLNPVDESIAPGYYDVIQNPVDLSTIERKIRLKAYQKISQVDLDFRRMVTNCQIYNGKTSGYTEMARTLWHAFRKGISQISMNSKSTSVNNGCTESYCGSVFGSKKADGVSSDSEVPGSNRRSVVRKKRRRRGRLPNMQGLSMLAEASEQAVKVTNESEGNLFLQASADLVSLNAKDYPDLKIAPLQNHSPSLIAKYSSSDSDSNQRSALSPASMSSGASNCEDTPEIGTVNCPSPVPQNPSTTSCSPDSSYHERDPNMPDLPPVNAVESDKKDHNGEDSNEKEVEKEVGSWPVGTGGKIMSPDSCNQIITPRSSSRGSSASDRLSNSDTDQSKNISELDLTCRILGINGDMAKSDALSSLSSLLCRIIKENQDFHLQDGQVFTYPSGDDLSPSSGFLKLSPNNSVPSIGSANRSPLDSETFYSPPSETSVHPSSPQFDSAFNGSQTLRNITTVDASILGLSSNIECRPNDRLLSHCSPSQLSSRLENFQSFQPTAATQEFENNDNNNDARPDNINERPMTNETAPRTSHFSHLSEALKDLSCGEEEYGADFERINMKETQSLVSLCNEAPVEEQNSNQNSSALEAASKPCESDVQTDKEFTTETPEGTVDRCAVATREESFVPNYSASVTCASDSTLPVSVPFSAPVPIRLSPGSGSFPMFMGQTQPMPVNVPVPMNAGLLNAVQSSSQHVLRPLRPFYANSQIPVGTVPDVSAVPRQGFSLPSDTSSPKSAKKSRKKKKVAVAEKINKIPLPPLSQRSPSAAVGSSTIASPDVDAFSSQNDPMQFLPPPPLIQQSNIADGMYQGPPVCSSECFRYDRDNPLSTLKNDVHASTSTVFASYAHLGSGGDGLRMSGAEFSPFWSQNGSSFYNIPYSSVMVSQPLPVSSSSAVTSFTMGNSLPIVSSDKFLSSMTLSSAMSVSRGNPNEHDPNQAVPEGVSSVNIGSNIPGPNMYGSFPITFAKQLDPRTVVQQPVTIGQVSGTQENERNNVLPARNDDIMPPFMIGPPRFPAGIALPGQQMQPPRFFNIPPPSVMISAQPSLNAIPQVPFFPTASISSVPFSVDSSGNPGNGSPTVHVPVAGRTLPVYTILSNGANKSTQD